MSDVPHQIVPPPAEGSSAPTPTSASDATAVAGTGTGEKKDLQGEANRLIAEGKKAIALKQWEEGVTKYADALDIMREIVGEFDPKMAPLLLSYGKALYELAWSQQGVMGKEEVDKTAEGARQAVQEEEEEEGPVGGNFSFAEPAFEGEVEGDGEGEGDGEEVEGGDDQEGAPEGEGEGEGDAEGEGGDEPEDDFNAAWEVLDVARTIYLKTIDDRPGEELKVERLQLADTYIALGDVSCETENFPQAVSDYTSALNIQTKLLPVSSRSLASTHYQLATSLEFIPQKRTEALSHVQKALESFKALRTELQQYSEGNTGAGVGAGESIKKMTTKERETELKDVEALLGDLEVKIEELRAAPEVPDLVTRSIDHLLGKQGEGSGSGSGGGFGGASGSGGGNGADAMPVNDLTSMVRKKPAKKAPVPVPAPAAAAAPAPANGTGSGSGQGVEEVKRKAEDEANEAGTEKKARVE